MTIPPERQDARTQSSLQTERRAEGSSGFSLGSIFGIRIHVDVSLFIVFGLIVFNLGAMVFPAWHPDWGPGLLWGVSIAAAVLFFASILAHELMHAVVGRAQGIPVSRITLFIFGGMAHVEGGPPSPKAEFLMAIVGPLTSIAIGILSILGGAALAGPVLQADLLDNESVLAIFGRLGPLPTLLLWLGPINVLLGLFNLVPGFPLDGGRVLRSILWWATGDLVKATRWATGAGQVVAWALMAFGLFQVFAGALLQGLWLLLIGWFLSKAARASAFQLLARTALEDIPVRRIMRTNLTRVAPDLTVDTFVREALLASDQSEFPVEEDGQFYGIVGEADVRTVPPARWSETRVRDIMRPVGQLPALPPTATADRALEQLSREDVGQVPVMEQDQLLGMVRRQDLMKWLSLRNLSGDSGLRAPS